MKVDQPFLLKFRKVMEELVKDTFSADIVLDDEFLISLIKLAERNSIKKELLLNLSYVRAVFKRGFSEIANTQELVIVS